MRLQHFTGIFLLILQLASAQIAENLKSFIGASQGISFISDAGNGAYLGRVHYGNHQLVLADKTQKSRFTKFYVHDVGNELLAFECDRKGSGMFWHVYLAGPGYHLRCVHQGSVNNLNSWNKFQSYSLDGGKKVAFRFPNLGKYIKRVYTSARDSPAFQYLSPSDTTITSLSTFGFDVGCIHRIEYEILQVTFDKTNRDPDSYTPTLVDRVEIINESNSTVRRSETLSFTMSRTETTTWDHHFGVKAQIKFEGGLIAKLVADVEFKLTLSYDYKTGGSTAVTNQVQSSESVTVDAEPGMKTVVELIVLRDDAASIPFNAKVRSRYIDDATGQVKEEETWQSGTWSGVLLYKTMIHVRSEPLRNV